MTSKNKKSGMVSNQSNNNATGLLPSILRLYRNNDTWRGAVDLTRCVDRKRIELVGIVLGDDRLPVDFLQPLERHDAQKVDDVG